MKKGASTSSALRWEVDVIASVEGQLVPFEVKYRGEAGASDLRGMRQFCKERKVERGYVITKNLDDFGVLPEEPGKTPILKIPAALACYWLGQGEATEVEE